MNTVATSRLLASTIRILSAEAVQKANSGHPGMPMGTADLAAVLWSQFLRFNPAEPHWAGRDRFVLSAGHGSMLLYSMLHLFGYDLSLEDLKNFRQWGSRTPGHPEFGMTPGVETTTGPLGAGFANGVGIALSEKKLAEIYSRDLFGSTVYGIVSDGDLMEGVASEAASLAGHLALDNLVYLYDDNRISIGGGTDICFTESVPSRFEAYGWYVQSCDGHNQEEIAECIRKAKAQSDKPSIICARTTIGYGSPSKAGTADSHGAPLGQDDLDATKKALGWTAGESFFVPEEVKAFCAEVVSQKKSECEEWEKNFAAWKSSNRELAEQYERQSTREIPSGLKQDLLDAFAGVGKDATRSLSGKAIQVIASKLPFFLGGSADLEPSNKTLIKDDADCTKSNYAGRNIRFGVREHAMGALVNGLAYQQSWIPYSATFLVFADYMRPTMRLAALSHLQSLFIFTHDSFWVGEDGPTHEPIEHIESLRIIPNLYVFRPADGREVALCYWKALEMKDRPSTLLFTRQNVEPLQSHASDDEILKGAYVVSGSEHTDYVVIATGSEVSLAAQALALLGSEGIRYRLVSMPCKELFLELSSAEQAAIIPPHSKRISLEAGITTGWRDIVGIEGDAIGIDHFGASAPGEKLAEEYGFTPEKVADRLRAFATA